MGFFPVDDNTLDYMRRTGRTDEEVAIVETYCKEQGLFRLDSAPTPIFTRTLGFGHVNRSAFVGWTKATARPDLVGGHEEVIQ